MKPRKDSADKGAGSGCMARLVRLGFLRSMPVDDSIEVDCKITFNGKNEIQKVILVPLTSLKSSMPSEPVLRPQKYRTKYRFDPSSSHEP